MERNARIAALTYGAVCYALFFATFLYLIAFVADVGGSEDDRVRRRDGRRPRVPRRLRSCSSSSASSTA